MAKPNGVRATRPRKAKTILVRFWNLRATKTTVFRIRLVKIGCVGCRDKMSVDGKVSFVPGDPKCWESNSVSYPLNCIVDFVNIDCCSNSSPFYFFTVGQKLTGTLPSELAALPYLQQITLPYNEINGTIPSEWVNLKHLINIEVHGNMLDGTIPQEFYDEDQFSLVNFNIGDNMFEGELDTRIGEMTDLKGLHIFENNLNGTFPSEVGNLNYLSFSL